MSLVTCKVCNKEHAKVAKVCPHCGNTGTPFQQQQAIGAVILLVVLFVVVFDPFGLDLLDLL